MEMDAEAVGLNTLTEFSVEMWFLPFERMNASYHMFFYFGGIEKAWVTTASF